jgi:hypothetical protein
MRVKCFLVERKRIKTNMAEEYCWAITLSEGSRAAADKFLVVLRFGCQLHSVQTYAGKAQSTLMDSDLHKIKFSPDFVER